MALSTAYLITTKNLDAFLNAIKTAKAPERVNQKFLANLEFASSNDRLFIGILKALGFTDDSGVPTKRYFEFLDQSRSGAILAEAIREAYSDLFALNTKAQELSVDEVKNKLRTLTQGQNSENVLGLMAKTFKALTDLADWKAPVTVAEKKPEEGRAAPPAEHPIELKEPQSREIPGRIKLRELHYNIQIVLPETRDTAIFDAIFASLQKHLLQ
ncbi:MAG TPA: DUF5343 domain-containing protein [Bryobacteraceae bacterium]|jgi:hypothetical protein|nr:DUF5343 domain-containing protein [Bryobacteraceae bacterium]